jgi:hypothetical protein
MRATILLLGAVLAMAIATAREARCAGMGSRSHGALVLSVAAAGTRSTGTIATLRDFKALLGLVRLPEVSHAVEAVLAGPQVALGIARSNSAQQLVLEPAYVKLGRSRHPALALSGRF